MLMFPVLCSAYVDETKNQPCRVLFFFI